jgi:hypothetical protein
LRPRAVLTGQEGSTQEHQLQSRKARKKRELCHDINLLQILNFRVSTEGLDDRDCAEF